VHPALSPHVQMTDSPVVQNSTRPKMRSNPPYGHRMAVSTTQARLHIEPRSLPARTLMADHCDGVHEEDRNGHHPMFVREQKDELDMLMSSSGP
jgi:hypothetical protein